mgnify:CR=1 FL=1
MRRTSGPKAWKKSVSARRGVSTATVRVATTVIGVIAATEATVRRAATSVAPRVVAVASAIVHRGPSETVRRRDVSSVAATKVALGLDPAGHYTDAANRPYRLTAGDPVLKLFG